MLWKKKKIRKKVRTTEVNKIVTVVLKKDDISYADEAYQWNYGQILRIQGGNLPKAVEVHFSLVETSGTSVTRIGTTSDGVTEAPIPDSLLENNNCSQDYTIYAYIYLEDGTAGRTEYEIAIPVKARTKPEVPGTPEEPELFRAAIKAVNDAADRAETAEQNAKSSEAEAGKYATSASESAATAEKTKEDALRKVGEKKQEAIEAIQEQEETSIGKIINHTDNEIQRIQNQTAGSKRELEQTITNAGASKEELDESIQTASDTKTALDKSTELAGTAKTELDTSTQKAGEAKTALDGSTKTAGEMQETLSATVKQAGALDTSLGEKIETGTQLKTDLVASGAKAVQNIQTAGSEQLGKMQAVVEEFTADREQITTNKEDISILKEEMSKNYLDDAKTKRSLDALWKLNQGISYQFETDDSKAYQKDIPSGAKLASVKKIGGRTIVWNQLVAKQAESEHNYGLDFAWLDNGKIKISGTSAYAGGDPNVYTILKSIEVIGNHKYLFKLTGTDRFCILGYGIGDSTPQTQKLIFNALDSGIENIAIYGIKEKIQSGTVIDDIVCPQIYDLTQMFGAGNEPSTPEEFEAMFPKDYYQYNEGELMSIPVNEVVEHGRNLFDCYGFSCGGIYDENIKRDITNNYGTTISTINPTNSITVTQDKVDNSAVISSYVNGYFCVGVRMKNNKEYVMSFDFIPTKMLIDNPIMRLLINGDGSNSSGAIDGFSLNVKKHIVVKFTYKIFESRQYIEFRNGGMSGIFENFQLDDGATATAYSLYHKNTYPIPQAILNLDGYGDGVSSDVYNYVDWENKQYHKRVGEVDLGTLPWETYRENVNLLFTTNKLNNSISKSICSKYVKKTNTSIGKEDKFYYFNPSNMVVVDSSYSDVNDFKVGIQGVMLYYNLAEEEIIDISDIIDTTFQEPIEVEAGGTLTFHNSNGDGYQLPIPNEEEYIVSLAEVGGGASE